MKVVYVLKSKEEYKINVFIIEMIDFGKFRKWNIKIDSLVRHMQ
jgi:hypothetical protein